jgi:EARP and GARP complex-interacting protein 1
VTSGNDRFAKVWDLRNSKAPVERLLAGHTHWVTRAQYNPVHDQLIATGGSDSAVNMWRVASCSSSPWLGDGGGSSGSSGDGADGTDGETTTGNKEGRGGDEPPDMSVKNVDLHEDSVYGLAWSAASPWMCCSLSYDGRVVLSHVLSAEKYKILL